jgi:cation:H+ antiporter
MGIIFWISILILSLAVLVKSSDEFTKAAEKIGLHLKLSPFIVGVTIVAIGTSLPELISSIIAVIQNNSEIVAGNVVGSNITNVLLILGLSAIFAKKIKIKETFLRIDLMVFITSATMLILIMLNGVITLAESIILVICFVLYIMYIIKSKTPTGSLISPDIKNGRLKLTIYLSLAISIIFLFISAKSTIDSIVQISNLLGIGKEIIAITIVAFGTSLPELAVSVSAARRGQPEIAVGNILGSNIFNIFFVTGVAGLFGTLIVTSQIALIGSIFLILSTFLYFFAVKDRAISKWEGFFLVLLYILFLIQIVGWA